MTSKETLSESFKYLLEGARLQYAEFMQSKHLPFTTTNSRIAIIDNEDETGWQSEDQSLIVNTARSHIFEWPPWQGALREACLDLAADLVSTYTTTLPFWDGFFATYGDHLVGELNARPEFKSEPNIWIAKRIIIPATVEYLRSISSVEASDVSRAAQITDEALTLKIFNV